MHPSIKPRWQQPQAPEGFPTLIAFEYEDGSVVIDFLNDGTKSFASEEGHEVPVEWPWADGFHPTGTDWETAGFAFITAKPCPHH